MPNGGGYTMLKSKLILLALITASMGAEAMTFCTNAMSGKGGAVYMLLLRDVCPPNTSRIGGMQRFDYVLSKKDRNSCEYRSSLTKETGEKLICRTNLKREEVAATIRRKRLQNHPYLSRFLRGDSQPRSEVIQSRAEEPAQNNPPSDSEGQEVLH